MCYDVNTDLHAETLLLNVGQSDGLIVLPRLLHQETLLPLVFLHMLLCGWTHHGGLDLCKTETHGAIYLSSSWPKWLLNSHHRHSVCVFLSDRTTEVRGSL